MTFFYDDFANGLWSPTANVYGQIDVLADAILAVAVDIGTYVADGAAEKVLQDIIDIGGIIATSDAVTGLAVVTRGFTSNPLNFVAPPAGPDIGAIVFYMDTGDPTTSPLFLYADDAAGGLPATPDGVEDVVVNPGAGGWAVL